MDIQIATDLKISPTTFATIFPLWRDHLWPKRVTPIEPTSALMCPHGYNKELLTRKPTFLIAHNKKNIHCIYGVISGFYTAQNLFRSRGLYVHKKYRGHGIGQLLMTSLIQVAVYSGATRIWTMPRKSSMGFYKNCGFQKITDWIDDKFEFGPNCFAEKNLTHDETSFYSYSRQNFILETNQNN